MKNEKMIEVVYLAYLNEKIGYGISEVEKFLESYNAHPAGIEHKLIILATNWTDRNLFKKLCELTEANNAQIIELPSDGLDFGAYFRFTKKSKADYIFFLGSSINILADNWLINSYQSFKDSKVKLAGPMGSWESPEYLITKNFLNLINSSVNFYFKVKKIIRFIFSNFRYIKLKPLEFPNYHIRTSAFMIERNIFLNYIKETKFPKTKYDTYQIEHGRKSLTKFVLNNGYNAVVVNSEGEIFDPENWIESQTFRTLKDCKSYFSDKQTRLYQEANIRKKRKLQILAWENNYEEKINVVFLSRGEDYGLEYAKNFFNSYRKNYSGVKHQLIILAKAWENKREEYDKLIKLAKKYKAAILNLEDSGFDIGAYIKAAKLLDDEYILFLNSSVRILVKNWLTKFYKTFDENPDIQLIGAMGSWESGITESFPNPHIRTNAFWIERKLFLEYFANLDKIETKDDTYEIEHGKNSLTKFVLDKGYKVVVVNSDGEFFEPKNWIESQTFRHPINKSIFSDKHSKIYSEADNDTKRILEQLSWGQCLTKD